jgi:hypothetical protein
MRDRLIEVLFLLDIVTIRPSRSIPPISAPREMVPLRDDFRGLVLVMSVMTTTGRAVVLVMAFMTAGRRRAGR